MRIRSEGDGITRSPLYSLKGDCGPISVIFSAEATDFRAFPPVHSPAGAYRWRSPGLLLLYTGKL
jgi:hypothetical protein